MSVTINKPKRKQKHCSLRKNARSDSMNGFQKPLIKVMGSSSMTMAQIADAFYPMKLPTVRYQVRNMVLQGRLTRMGEVGANGAAAIRYSLNAEWAKHFPEWFVHIMAKPL